MHTGCTFDSLRVKIVVVDILAVFWKPGVFPLGMTRVWQGVGSESTTSFASINLHVLGKKSDILILGEEERVGVYEPENMSASPQEYHFYALT